MNAIGISPHLSSGTPITAASMMSGCFMRILPTATDEVFSPPGMVSIILILNLRSRGVKLTTNYNVLCAVQDLNSPIRMPHCQITRMHPSSGKELYCHSWIFVVFLSTHISLQNNLSDLQRILGNVNQLTPPIRLDHPNRKPLFCRRKCVPLGQMIRHTHGPVRLGQSVSMDGVQIQTSHLLE